MDKIKTFFRYIKRQQFWLICAVIVVLGGASWWQSTAELTEQKKKNVEAIKSAGQVTEGVKRVVAIEGIEGHPNEIWKNNLNNYMAQTREEVAAAWQVKDEIQASILVWPEVLQDDFIRQVKQMRPIEAKVPYPPVRGKGLPPYLLGRYADYIELELPKLAKIVKARWAPARTSGSGRGGGFRGGEDMTYAEEGYDGRRGIRGRRVQLDDGMLVDWSAANQGELLAEHFDWSNTKIPNTLQVLYAQEDYWVLKALMQVVAKTNEGATGRHNTKIRQIYFLHIGKDVGPSAGTIADVEAAVSADAEALDGEGEFGDDGGFDDRGEMERYSEDESEGSRYVDGRGDGEDFGMMDERSGGRSRQTRDPAERRYVDKNYEPLAGEALRAAMTSTDPEDVYLAVAKRMPVRMRFQMDQRAIPRLLLACSNSPLTIEVRQVRMYRDVSEMRSASGSPLRGGGMDRFGGESRGFGRGDGGFAFGGRLGNSSALKLPTGFDVAVEVYGIIYIYNPVDRSKLGIEAGEGDPSNNDVAQRAIRQR